MSETTYLIERAMKQSRSLTDNAADEHLRAFKMQMREKIGVDDIAFNEPYLPFVLARCKLKYLRRMERLQQRLTSAKALQVTIQNPENSGPIGGNGDTQEAIDGEKNRANIAAKQDLDAARQRGFGIKRYMWVGGDCPQCAPNDGEIFTWGEGDEPGTIHYNCNCSAEPVLDDSGIDDPPIEPVYPLESLAGLLAGGGLARALGRAAIARARGEGAPAESGRNTNWTFGSHKSDTKWNNQMQSRGWTNEKITDTIENGKEYRAPNKVNPGNGATRYEKDGKFVVRDDETGEILQIGNDEFKPNQL
jgi:hypothetical protein